MNGVILGAFLDLWIPRRTQAKKNKEQIDDLRKALDRMNTLIYSS